MKQIVIGIHLGRWYLIPERTVYKGLKREDEYITNPHVLYTWLFMRILIEK